MQVATLVGKPLSYIIEKSVVAIEIFGWAFYEMITDRRPRDTVNPTLVFVDESISTTKS